MRKYIARKYLGKICSINELYLLENLAFLKKKLVLLYLYQFKGIYIYVESR